MATGRASLVVLLGMSIVSLSWATSVGVEMKIVNNCAYTVWPGIQPRPGKDIIANGGMVLQPGEKARIPLPKGWAGTVWGRQGCTFNNNVGRCESGDCGGNLQCKGLGGTPPATLAELTLADSKIGTTNDSYYISLLDGYNIPMSIVPKGRKAMCPSAHCSADLNTGCPSVLQVKNKGGSVVGCKSACLAFKTPKFCCGDSYSNRHVCKPSSYSLRFKYACPKAFSYPFDDPRHSVLARLLTTLSCPSALTLTLTLITMNEDCLSSRSLAD